MGFLGKDTPNNDLPLLIEFEAKSIEKKYDLAKELMEAKYDSILTFHMF